MKQKLNSTFFYYSFSSAIPLFLILVDIILCSNFVSYELIISRRYVRNLPANQNLNLAPFNIQKIQPPFVQYDAVFSQLGQMPRTQASLSYVPPSSPAINPFCAMGLNQTSSDAAYMQWSTAAMMYAHSYDQFRHTGFQVGRCP